MSAMTRGDFLKSGLAVGASALLAGAGLAGCSTQSSPSDAASDVALSDTGEWTYETDVVIVGSGIGGFSAALKAQEDGADTVIVEANKWTGGGSAYCGGVLQCSGSTSLEEFSANTRRMSERELSRVMAETFFTTIPDWFEDMGAEIINPGAEGKFFCRLGSDPSAATYGCRPFFDSLEEIYLDNGGQILFETCAEHIMTEGEYDKTIIGLWCKDAGGNKVTIKAKSVVLACGGFQNNDELRTRYLGENAEYAGLMGVPWNYGAGMRMAQEVGASLAGNFGEFAACMASAYPAHNPQEDAATFKERHFDDNGEDSIYFLADSRVDTPPNYAIIVNCDGERYVDEGTTDNVHAIPIETIRQPFATGYYIMDSVGWESFMAGDDGAWSCITRNNKDQFDQVILSEAIGGSLYQADTIEELADAINSSDILSHRISKAGLVETLKRYNEAAAAKDPDLYPPRTVLEANTGLRYEPIEQGPFYCWPARPYIYHTYGGVAIDSNCQVLDQNRAPIPGLFAAAPTAGGVMGYVYSGSMASASSTGYLAGQSAAAALNA